ncbi:hypothetical protein M6B38_115000 [Iris pallida]|uniref:Uncharacterized protein n=1 Tax=Iris pallida TaxID=29817 RepID=A0AAX6I519_IRIPA|nr:hypothetical protein M6B38_115000 [Iris pallida]
MIHYPHSQCTKRVIDPLISETTMSSLPLSRFHFHQKQTAPSRRTSMSSYL